MAVRAGGARAQARVVPLLSVQGEQGRDRRLELRHFGAMMLQTSEEYLQGWRAATIDTVLRELALHVQLSARVVSEKYVAISRLYVGLMVLVFLTAAMLSAVVIRALLAMRAM
jgi:hypothetical protein